MPEPLALIPAWARCAVAPLGGALGQCAPHELAAPVVQGLLRRAGLPSQAVDAVVAGNALGAGGNPARLVALAAGLPERVATYSVDTQCCAGLDAVALGVGLIASGQAELVVAGGVEAWSRAPIRQHRPRHPGDAPVPFDRPAFAPEPWRDPDMLWSAAQHALVQGVTRAAQDAYALQSHARALQHQAQLADEIVPVAGVAHDLYPRALDPSRMARLPAVVKRRELGLPLAEGEPDTSLSALTISAKADGAAFVLLASPAACQRWGLRPRTAWVGHASMGGDPATPLVMAAQAALALLRRQGVLADALHTIELHDAFAVQGLQFAQALGLDPQRLNRRGGGLARGHPIGASAAVALVRALADLWRDGVAGDLGLCAVAGAGGLGSAALLRRL